MKPELRHVRPSYRPQARAGKGRSGAVKRRQRGRAAYKPRCRCGLVLVARRGVLRCPAHGSVENGGS